MPSASTQPATPGPLEGRISGESSLALWARSDAEPGARADRRARARRGSTHHAVGDCKKSLSYLKLAAHQKRLVMQEELAKSSLSQASRRSIIGFLFLTLKLSPLLRIR